MSKFLNLAPKARMVPQTVPMQQPARVDVSTARDWTGAINPAEEAAQRRAVALRAMNA